MIVIYPGDATWEVRPMSALPVDPPPVDPPPVDPPPDPGAPLAWSRYPCTFGSATYPEAEYQSWYNLAYDSKRDVFYGMDWGGVVAAFSPPAQSWTKVTPSIGGGTHNRAFGYDPVNDRLWIGDGTGSTLLGINYLDLVTNTIVPFPMTGKTFGTQSAFHYDAERKRFIVFGGWNRLGVYTWSVDPPAATMTYANIPAGPTWDGGIAAEAKKMTMQRSGVDLLRKRIVYVDTDGTLWTLPLDLSTGFAHVTTTGTMPPPMTQFVVDPVGDRVIGWSASSMIAGGAVNTPPTQETWILSLATLEWSMGASLVGGQTVPPVCVFVGYSVIWDPVRQQMVLHTTPNNYTPSTWGLK